MSRPKNPTPTYRHHKTKNVAYSDFYGPDGRRRSVCLGPWDSPESRQEHARLCAEVAAGRTAVADGLTVSGLLLAFLTHAEEHYRRPDGTNTDELSNYKKCIRVARESHGHVPVKEFGPLALKAVRQRMVDRGWARKNINLHVGRLRRVFKFGVENELVPPAVLEALKAVTGLQAGRTKARETGPILPVPDDLIDRTLPHLSRHAAGLVRFQRLTGCRPGDAVRLRRCDLDTAHPVWVFRPPHHKLSYQGRGRAIHLGPQAQALLTEFPTATPDEYVFSPRRELAERSAKRAAVRRTKYYASRQGHQVRKAKPKVAPGEKYTVGSYGYAIRRACAKHGLDPWHPNRIRHLVGTLVREVAGLEAAQSVLGHARANTTEIYAERVDRLAVENAERMG